MKMSVFISKVVLGRLMERPLAKDEVREMTVCGHNVRVSRMFMQIDGERIAMHERDGTLFLGTRGEEDRLRDRLADIDRQMEQAETEEAKEALAFAARENERGHDRRMWK